jgi:3-oxoacyl-[acyl-carrier-protein] synthase-3
MPGTTILGTGRYLPGQPVTNEALARVMETSAEWITQRSGIAQRHYAGEGEGASDLGLPAARSAIEAAGLHPEQIDYILFNTMTPDYVFPGSGALLGAKLGIPGVPALDLRRRSRSAFSSRTRCSRAAPRVMCSSSEPKRTRGSCRGMSGTS